MLSIAPPILACDAPSRCLARVPSVPSPLSLPVGPAGSPDAPKCGFSRKVVEALREAGASFGHFDILTDEGVRQGMKAFGNWPTYPQLYARGELLGGCDIVLEMAQKGELKASLAEALSAAAAPAAAAAAQLPLRARIETLLASSPVLLFMKGNTGEPKCGFSRKVADALTATEVPFATFDILGDEEIRQGLKEYSDWPTYPQLYVKGELLGGCARVHPAVHPAGAHTLR